MATFTRVKTWVSNEVLTASDLNGEFNNLLNNMDPLGIEDYSDSVSEMQSTADPGGVGTESLATTLAGEIQRIRFALKRIVGGAQWYSTPVFNLGSTISTADIEDGAVTTAKLADNAVTRAKTAAVGQQVSSSSGAFSSTSQTTLAVTNLVVSITTTGRPVYIGLQQDSSSNPGYIGISTTSNITTLAAKIYLIRNNGVSDTTVATHNIAMTATPSSSTMGAYMPISGIQHIDVVSSGTYSYTVAFELDSASSVFEMAYAKLVVYEL